MLYRFIAYLIYLILNTYHVNNLYLSRSWENKKNENPKIDVDLPDLLQASHVNHVTMPTNGKMIYLKK